VILQFCDSACGSTTQWLCSSVILYNLIRFFVGGWAKLARAIARVDVGHGRIFSSWIRYCLYTPIVEQFRHQFPDFPRRLHNWRHASFSRLPSASPRKIDALHMTLQSTWTYNATACPFACLVVCLKCQSQRWIKEGRHRWPLQSYLW